MGFLENTDVQTILKDKTLVNELSEDAAKASEVMSELAGDEASELGDQLEDAGLPTAEYTQAW